MLRGGGVAFGPTPRDFSTDLPKKIYDRALRTALSYRFGRGELLVVDGPVDLPFMLKDGARLLDAPEEELIGHLGDVTHEIYARLGWDKARTGNRSLFVTKEKNPSLVLGFQGAGDCGKALTFDTTEVRDLLKMNRVVIEREALDSLLESHQSDLVRHSGLNPTGSTAPENIERLYRQMS